MATAKKTATTVPQRRPSGAAAAPAAPAPAASTTDIEDAGEVVEKTEGDKISLGAPDLPVAEMVTVVVPKQFTLTLDHHHVITYEAGVYEMPEDHASHWFSRANGVKVYEPTKKAK